ncbi:hypothetical protein EDB85DRAFT_2188092 [Lactarius pseudohatsudake]|nr:hypothetical protein EDB85DRAFT_2188092 [Lactarius pseudohatsudake]
MWQSPKATRHFRPFAELYDTEREIARYPVSTTKGFIFLTRTPTTPTPHEPWAPLVSPDRPTSLLEEASDKQSKHSFRRVPASRHALSGPRRYPSCVTRPVPDDQHPRKTNDKTLGDGARPFRRGQSVADRVSVTSMGKLTGAPSRREHGSRSRVVPNAQCVGKWKSWTMGAHIMRKTVTVTYTHETQDFNGGHAGVQGTARLFPTKDANNMSTFWRLRGVAQRTGCEEPPISMTEDHPTRRTVTRIVTGEA